MSFDTEYTYRVPEEISKNIHVGVFVDVPFGGGNKKELGVVVGLDPDGEDSVTVGKRKLKLKEVLSVNGGYRPLDTNQLALGDMMARRYICGAAEVYGLMTAKLPKEKEAQIKVIRLRVTPEEAEAYIRGRRAVKEGGFAAIRMLCGNPSGVPEKTVLGICEIGPAVLKRFVDDGIAERTLEPASRYENEDEKIFTPEREKDRDDAGTAPASKKREVVLNAGQEEALKALSKLLFSGKFSEFLLRGVTGSGKTEVYFRLIRQALDFGYGAILLVPEIVLTEQMIKRVRNAFGDGIAVLHSRITEKKKAEEYARIDSGEVKLVLGVRSAVFAPVRDLKLIILDEEQEPSFKSFDARPYYHAGEVAAMRLKQTEGLLVYGSATPRVTTYYKAVMGKIGYAFLKERAFAQSLPEVRIVDMKEERASGNTSAVSVALSGEIRENLKRGEQSIIFLPRRGYSSKIVCGGCGKMIVCRNCGIPMTYHKENNRLVCHYCGVSKPMPEACPGCGSRELSGNSFGTERAEETISKLFPDVPVVRMDSDTTKAVDGHKKLLEKFEQENVPILIGTQMVAKGLDFPNVTLVGIVNADSLMAINEYNANERAFQLLTQVTGRAGRDPSKPGRCVLQTMNPSSFVVRTAATQDYDKYSGIELDYRKILEFPPYSSFATVTVSGGDDREIFKNTLFIRSEIEIIANEKGPGDVKILSVTRSALKRVEDNYFWCFAVKSADPELLLDIMNRLKETLVIEAYKKGCALPDGRPVKNFRISIDAETG